jgi:hypothetical protein
MPVAPCGELNWQLRQGFNRSQNALMKGLKKTSCPAVFERGRLVRFSE